MKTIFGQQTTKVKQLADLISQDISMGRYKTDTALPSINQLSHDYKVSRDTVFKAFIDLKERGIIDSTPGKGYLRRLLPENCFHIAYTGLIKVRIAQATVLNCAGAKKDYLF